MNDYFQNQNPFTNGEKADAAEVNAELEKIQSGFDLLPKPREDGGGFLVPVKVADAVDPADVINKGQFDAQLTANEQNKTDAETAQAAAEAARDKAFKWSEEATDIAVELGKYSAKHHAEKSGLSASSAATSAGNSENSNQSSIAAKAASEAARDLSQSYAASVNPAQTMHAIGSALGNETYDALAIDATINGVNTSISAKLNSADYTASDVLTKVKTVDGVGSGLDADLLDGIQGALYLLKSEVQALHATDALRISGTTVYLYKGNGSFESVSIPAPTTAQVGAATAGLAAGAVGSYAFLIEPGANSSVFGGTQAGSTLYPAGMYGAPANIDSGYPAGVAGTWRCMGKADMNLDSVATVWLRIS